MCFTRCQPPAENVYINTNICTYFEPGQPCPKLCEPSVKEGVEKVDVDDHIDQVERVAEKIGESVPAQAESCHRKVSWKK